jgi:hypothetical protein
MIAFTSVVNELNRLLDLRFISDRHHKTPLGSMLYSILEINNSGDYFRRDYELAKVALFVKNLQNIEKHDKQLLNRYRYKIRKLASHDNYFGTRLEVNICSSLIRKKVNFEALLESSIPTPDFVIHLSNDVFIECTSAHLAKPKNVDLAYKIQPIIDKKASKNYCRPNTALFIDATNIFFHSLRNNAAPEAELFTKIQKMSKDTQFGSILIFRYIIDPTNQSFIHVYNRFDNDGADAALLCFLDTHYQFGNNSVQNYLQPSNG